MGYQLSATLLDHVLVIIVQHSNINKILRSDGRPYFVLLYNIYIAGKILQKSSPGGCNFEQFWTFAGHIDRLIKEADITCQSVEYKLLTYSERIIKF